VTVPAAAQDGRDALGDRVGVMNGNTFTKLPGVTGRETIAW
jgi:hypothetical protein